MVLISPNTCKSSPNRHSLNTSWLQLHTIVYSPLNKPDISHSALTIAECAGDLSLERMLENVARKQGKFTMAIGFDILGLDHDPDHVFYPRKWTLEEVRQKLVLAQELCEPQHDAWTPNYL